MNSAPSGFSSNTNGDINMIIAGQRINVEVKLNHRAQMGSSQLILDDAGTITPHENLKSMCDSDYLESILQSACDKKQQIAEYLRTAGTLLGADVATIPCVLTSDVRIELKNRGLSKAIASTVIVPVDHIIRHYALKQVDYIQVGNAGLFYLAKNPLNLPIPQFAGVARAEIRLKYGARRKNDNGQRVEWAVTNRLLTQIRSPYTLDSADSARELLL